MNPLFLTLFCGFLLSVAAFSNDSLLPALFAIQSSLGVPIEQVQLVVPVFMFVSAGGQLVFGPASDRFGRRPALLAGLGCFLTGTLVALFSAGIPSLLAGRALQGFGSACCQVIARSILRDTNHGAALARAMALSTAIFSFGPIVAPLVGMAVVALGSWRAIFVAMGLLGLGLGAAAVFVLKETNAAPDPTALRPERLKASLIRVVTHPQSRFFLIVACLLYYGIISFVTNAPRFYRSQFGIEGLQFALLFASTGLGIIIGQLLNRRLIAKVGVIETTRLAATAMFAIAAAMLLLGLTGGLRWWSFTALVFGFNSLFLVVFTNTASLVIDPHKEIAGLAASIFGCMTQLISSLLILLTLPLFAGRIVPWSVGLLVVTSIVAVGMWRYRLPLAVVKS